MSLRLFTSESVTEGHPDKICDQVSDAILDAMLASDPGARVAVETLVTTGLVHVAGEVTTSSYVDIPGIVRKTITDIGYTGSDVWFDGRSCGVEISIGAQSPDIAQGVDHAFESREGTSADDLDRQGAGDQGIMFGYATNETDVLMPLPIWLAHRMSERLAEARHSGLVDFLRPDGKTQVTIGYDGTKPATVETVVVSTQHSADISTADLRAEVERVVIRPVLELIDLPSADARILINPTGRFEIGGPHGDAGTDRSQDHRRHLRRRFAARRRCLLGQRPVEGRPFGRVRAALGREERGRGRPRRPPRGAGRVRDRHGFAGRSLRRVVRHRPRLG